MNVTTNQYKHADEYGSYTVCFGERTIEVTFIGLLSEQLIEKYCEDLSLMLGVVEWQFWGYYGDLTKCDDDSSITRDVLVDLYKRFLKKGCIVEAYSIINSTAIDNIVKLRRAAGIEQSSLDNNLFADRLQAIEFIHSFIQKVEKKSAKSE